ncbi:MAG: hypothetical protein DWP98_03835 [Bacteroidetes bacterium]|nr:MAG: hypothetical protein DWP98_03835 [Bacteroidota bacterium]MCB0803830.1 hypothetical protein [Flavobacteriales bacterium]NOG56932.1 hypothetical protein [Bacteroidota bacterium]
MFPSLLFSQGVEDKLIRHQVLPGFGFVLPVGKFSQIDPESNKSGYATLGATFSLKYRYLLNENYGLSAEVGANLILRRSSEKYKSIDGSILEFETFGSGINSEMFSFLVGFLRHFHHNQFTFTVEPKLGVCKLNTREFEIYHQAYYNFEWQQFGPYDSELAFISGLDLSADYNIIENLKGGVRLFYLYSVVDLNPEVTIYKNRKLVFDDRMHRKQPVALIGLNIQVAFKF